MSRGAARWTGAALIAATLAMSARPTPAHAQAQPSPSCDAADNARLDRVLRVEARNASRWRWGWAAVFGGAVVGQLALAAADPFDDDSRHHARLMSLWLGAGKATIGLGARLVIPPKVARPSLTGDACADRRALAAAIARTARRERSSMALNVVGGLALNVGTSLWLGLREDSWTDAGISFAMGTVVSVVSAFTQPRRVWREGGVRADGPLLAPWRAAGASGLALAGSF